MNGPGAPTGCSARLVAAALVFLLGDGTVVPVIAAPPSLESTATATTPNGKAPAGSTGSRAAVTLGPSTMQEGTRPKFVPPGDWPAPVNDQEHRLFTLVDVLEFRPKTGAGQSNGYRWDVEGWYGGDYNRLWFKTEGQKGTAFKADYDVDFQLLYGRFIRKYYDLQMGGRVETQSFKGSNVTRGLGVIGIEGLV
ncbi:MAG: copper resistance protein B, partial [Nitrospiraceae bacterium]